MQIDVESAACLNAYFCHPQRKVLDIEKTVSKVKSIVGREDAVVFVVVSCCLSGIVGDLSGSVVQPAVRLSILLSPD